MLSKNTKTALTLLAIAVAAVGGWWYQNKPVTTAAPTGAAPPAAAPAGAPPVVAAPGAAPAGGPPPAAAPGGAPPGPPRAMGVEVALVEMAPLRDDAQTVGTLKSKQNTMVRPEVAGRVIGLGFTDGSQVRAGQILVQLDDSLQAAEIKQAQAQVSITQSNHRRNQELVGKGFIAQRALDESQASMEVAQAQLSLSCARWQRMRIVAPYSGTVGIRTVNVGDFVKDGTDLVNLEDLSALYVDFRLPERYQGKVALRQSVEVLIDALPNQTFHAQIEAIDPMIDANGRSISVRAVLPNKGNGKGSNQERPPVLRETPSSGVGESVCPSAEMVLGKAVSTGPLRPGMFARVNALFAMKQAALSVPEEAIVPMGGKQFVIKAVPPEAVPDVGALPPDTKFVSQRTEVKLGARRPGKVEILSGLSATDTVVVAGQHRLQKDGTPLRVVETRN